MAQPNHKDAAEFFRLGLLVDFCEPAIVARWAEAAVTVEAVPQQAFIELCTAESQPPSSVRSLLTEVLGHATPILSVQMLLGLASELVAKRALTPTEAVLRLHQVTRLENVPEHIRVDLDHLEDAISLARDGVYGTMAEVEADITHFLRSFEPHAPKHLL